jgi:hypothetical protein
MRVVRAFAAALLSVLATTAFAQEPASYGQAFVDAFAEACVPGRLSYQATLEAARAAGWEGVARDDHPELAAVLRRADEMLAADPEFVPEVMMGLMARDVAGIRHHLSLSETKMVIEEGDAPWVMVGCHLYGFDATAPLDPAPVTALIGKEISNSIDHEGLVGHVWGPPCAMPRTSDTYLSFVREGTPTAERVAFSGLSLNFATSTPDPGEVVPETYC